MQLINFSKMKRTSSGSPSPAKRVLVYSSEDEEMEHHDCSMERGEAPHPDTDSSSDSSDSETFSDNFSDSEESGVDDYDSAYYSDFSSSADETVLDEVEMDVADDGDYNAQFLYYDITAPFISPSEMLVMITHHS